MCRFEYGSRHYCQAMAVHQSLYLWDVPEMLISVCGHFAMAAIQHGCQVIHNCGQDTDLSPFSWATSVSQRRRYFISRVREKNVALGCCQSFAFGKLNEISPGPAMWSRRGSPRNDSGRFRGCDVTTRIHLLKH